VTGIALMPIQTSAHCVIPSQHTGQSRPRAAYLVFADGCQTRRCDGQLWCNGHPICIDCGIGVREGRLVYTRREVRGEPVTVAAITTAPHSTGAPGPGSTPQGRAAARAELARALADRRRQESQR
jgi:hypothetical protein